MGLHRPYQPLLPEEDDGQHRHDLRVVLRIADGRGPEPKAAIFDSRTVQSTPESGGRSGKTA